MKLNNIDMSQYLAFLDSIKTKVTGKVAYAVARNIRKISNEVYDYETVKNTLLYKYGETDESGRAFIKVGTQEYQKFIDEIKDIALIEHEVDLYCIDEEDIWKSELNADEILKMDFMIKEKETEKDS